MAVQSNESLSDSSKKRKRVSLTPKALQTLSQAFNLNSQPNGKLFKFKNTIKNRILMKFSNKKN